MTTATLPRLRAHLAVAVVQYGSLAKASDALEVPISTLHAWITGVRTPGKYAQAAMWEKLGKLGIVDGWEVKA